MARFRGDTAAPASRPDDFAVLEQPADEAQRLSGSILADVRPGRSENNDPAVTFDVKLEYQNVFNAWTGANVGLPMAIVLNGQYDSAPIIQSPLRDTVIVSLGGSGAIFGDEGRSRYDDLMERQKNLIAILQSGSLEVTPRCEAKSRVGPTAHRSKRSQRARARPTAPRAASTWSTSRSPAPAARGRRVSPSSRACRPNLRRATPVRRPRPSKRARRSPPRPHAA